MNQIPGRSELFAVKCLQKTTCVRNKLCRLQIETTCTCTYNVVHVGPIPILKTSHFLFSDFHLRR